MFEKYFKMIKEKTSQKDVVETFLRENIGLDDFSFDIVGNLVKIEASSQDRFKLKIREEEWREFLRVNNLRVK